MGVRHMGMLFLQKCVTDKIKYKIRILRRQKCVLSQMFCSPVKRFQRKIKKHFSGKVSLCASHENNGSMTVEATLVLPVFLFCILFILSFLEILRMQAGITMGLREAGRDMTAYAYGCQEKYSSLLSIAYADQKIKSFLQEEYLNQMPFEKGTPTIHYYRSSLKNRDECIDLIAQYKAEPDFNIFGKFPIPLTSRYYGKPWTGYPLNGAEKSHLKEENVYVTPGGEVYHRNRYCSHLQLTIIETSMENLKKERNQKGEKYLPCKYCGNRKGTGQIYITSDGNHYHTTLNCVGLKRTIDVIPISKVGDRKPCSRCGG